MATTVAAIGAKKATCSFHSMPNSCHPAIFSSASRKDLGKAVRSVVPSGGLARYHGYTIYVPVMTAAQAESAKPQTYTLIILTVFIIPSDVNHSGFME